MTFHGFTQSLRTNAGIMQTTSWWYQRNSFIIRAALSVGNEWSPQVRTLLRRPVFLADVFHCSLLSSKENARMVRNTSCQEHRGTFHIKHSFVVSNGTSPCSAWYSGGGGLESRPGNRPSWQVFCGFTQPLQRRSGIISCPKIHHDLHLEHP
jgi:hypothetical protein